MCLVVSLDEIAAVIVMKHEIKVAKHNICVFISCYKPRCDKIRFLI